MVTAELQIARQALGAASKEERAEILGENEKAKQIFMKFWKKNGAVCGRCQHFNSLGKSNSGTNGFCKIVPKSDYTKPEDVACRQYVKKGVVIEQ